MRFSRRKVLIVFTVCIAITMLFISNLDLFFGNSENEYMTEIIPIVEDFTFESALETKKNVDDGKVIQKEKILDSEIPAGDVEIVKPEIPFKDVRVDLHEEQKSVKQYFEIQDSCKAYENYDPFDPEIGKYFNIKNKSLYVKNEHLRGESRAYLDSKTHILSISDYEKKNPSCRKFSYSKIIFKDDFSSSFGEEKFFEIDEEVFVDHDFIRVTCYPSKESAKPFTSFHHQVTEKPETSKPSIDPKESQSSEKTNESNNELFNIVMIGFDSLSNGNLQRSLPEFQKTLKLLESERKCHVANFTHFNIVGDGTTDNLLSFLASELEKDLPDARRGRQDTVNVDVWPWIFKDFRKKGYRTSYGETWTELTAFQYRLKGFENPPVDHYLRTYLLSVPDKVKMARQMRDVVKWGYERVLDYGVEQMFQKYDRKKPIFSFNYIMDLHGRIVPAWNVGDYDLVLSKLFEKWYKLPQNITTTTSTKNEKRYLNIFEQDTFGDSDFGENTILIFFGDHGQRYGAYRESLFGRIEERNPPLIMILPRSFTNHKTLKRRNEAFALFLDTFRGNLDRLVTGYDVHATMQHLMNYDAEDDFSPVEKEKYKVSDGRHISLFYPIPEKRTCEDAGIQHHFCICANYIYINKRYYPQRKIYDLGIQKIIDHLNEHIELRNQQHKCQKLYLGEVVEVFFQLPQKSDLMKEELKVVRKTQEDEGKYSDERKQIYSNKVGMKEGYKQRKRPSVDEHEKYEYYMNRRSYRAVFTFTNEDKTYTGKMEGRFHIDHKILPLQGLKDDENVFMKQKYNQTEFSFVGEKTVSRLDSYGDLACHPIPEVRKFCSCVK